jgi:hypothetical protein
MGRNIRVWVREGLEKAGRLKVGAAWVRDYEKKIGPTAPWPPSSEIIVSQRADSELYACACSRRR